MKNIASCVKTLVLLTTFAFAGHALATQDTWFSVTANGSNLDLDNASTNGITEGVEVDQSVLSIDLPTSEVFPITPGSDTPAGATEGKTYIDVDGAVFTPTYTNDIDNTVLVGAQTALTVAYDDAPATNYYAYIGGEWIKLGGADPTESPVNVRIELDYSNAIETNVSFKVDDVPLYYGEASNTSFPISGEHRYLGRVDLAGYGSIHSVTTTVETAMNVVVTPGTITYGADFTNVTIEATLSGTGFDDPSIYTLTWNGSQVSSAVASVVGNKLTITAPIDAPSTGRAPATFSIDVNGTTGESQNTVVADYRNWVTENSTNQHTTGVWEAGDITYNENVATVADNTYTANSCTTGDLVTITFENLVYTELSDLSVTPPDNGVQGAFALAETNINNSVSTNFMILAGSLDNYYWRPTVCDDYDATTNVPYTVVMTFDYVNTNYTVTVNGSALKIDNNDKFPLCVVKSEVTDFVFKGSGTMSGIKGVDSLGYMAKDSAGHWYATIDAATKSGGSEFTVLRDTDPAAPAGWKFDTVDGIKKLVKAAKGVFFMVY